MNRTDLLVGGAFLALAIALAAGGAALPEGAGSAPGPGFFPIAIAIAMAALATALLWQSPRAASAAAGAVRWRDTAGAAALTFLYLALWGTGLFPLRTALFLLVLLRFLGESWKASAAVATTLTAVLFFAFQVGLRVSLE